MFTAKMFQSLNEPDSSAPISQPPSSHSNSQSSHNASSSMSAQSSLLSQQHLLAQMYQHHHPATYPLHTVASPSTSNTNASYMSLLYSLIDQHKQTYEKIVQLSNAIRHHRLTISDVASMQKVFLMEEQLYKESSELKRLEDYIGLIQAANPSLLSALSRPNSDDPEPHSNHDVFMRSQSDIGRADSMDLLTSTLSKVTKIDSRAMLPVPIEKAPVPHAQTSSANSSNSSSATSSPPSSSQVTSNGNGTSSLLNPLVRMKLRDHLLNKSSKTTAQNTQQIHSIKSVPNGVHQSQLSSQKKTSLPNQQQPTPKDRSPMQNKRLKSEHHYQNHTAPEIHCVQSEPSINQRKRVHPSEASTSSSTATGSDVRNILSSFLTNKAANKPTADMPKKPTTDENNNSSRSSPSGHAFKPLKKESQSRLSALMEHPQLMDSPLHQIGASMSLSALPQLYKPTPRNRHHPYHFGASLSASTGDLFIPQFGGNATHANAENELLIADEIQQSESAQDLKTDDDEMHRHVIAKSCSASHIHPLRARAGLKRHAPPNGDLLAMAMGSMDELTSRYYLAAAAMLLQQQQQQQMAAAAVSHASKMMCMSEPYLRPSFSSKKSTRGTATGIAYDERMMEHECVCEEPTKVHIETPARLHAIWSRLKSKGLLDECEVFAGENGAIATMEDVMACHEPAYAALFSEDDVLSAAASAQLIRQAPCRGLALASDQDNPWNPKYTALACRTAVACCYQMASAIVSGKLRNGFALVRPPGSHAEYNSSL